MNNSYSWEPFYKEFAYKLLGYKNNRGDLVKFVKDMYNETGISMPKLDSDYNLIDIDPFTVFGLFNKSSMKQENRLKIVNSLAKKLKVSVDVPTDFDGIPVLNNQSATFYRFYSGDNDADIRKETDIDDLWNLFDCALKYAENKTEDNRNELIKYFDIAINMKYNANSKITMGLFWVAPNVFLNLDSRNQWYIYESKQLPDDFVKTLPEVENKIAGAKYFEIVEKLQAYVDVNNMNFKELSEEAWRYSKQVSAENKEKAKSERDSKGSALADEDVDVVHYWLYSPGENASKWDECYQEGKMVIGWGFLGDLSEFNTKEDIKTVMQNKYSSDGSFKNDCHATWVFANEMKPGDIVFVKKGMSKVIGRGIVESDYKFDPNAKDTYKNIRKVKWTHNGEWDHPGKAVTKTLTDITKYTDYVEKLNALFIEEDGEEVIEEKQITIPEYSKIRFLEEVYMEEDKYNILTGLLKTKKNIILQGAPGVGKTFIAKRLAYSMMKEKDVDRVSMVQFHQSYSYEDFIEGFRPTSNGMSFDIKKGAFYNFCNKAAMEPEKDYFFIIDEINRGNLSKIFGELFMLIESDKRGQELPLLYSNDRFSVPKNVHIIGLMNTADRSLAMLDYALRRRFAFFTMEPGFDTEGFIKYRNKLSNDKFNRLINVVKSLNNEILNDESLGEGFLVGHSFFCNVEEVNNQVLSNIVEYELVPLLKEYWFDEPSKVDNWSRNLRDSIK